MTLVDTSVWVRHFQTANATLLALLDDVDVAAHPFIIGEVACGKLKNRDRTILELYRLPQAKVADEIDVRHLLEAHRLWGKGLGWVDVHILTAAKLEGWDLFTADRAMFAAARQLGIPVRES